jgi:hypothetical protein
MKISSGRCIFLSACVVVISVVNSALALTEVLDQSFDLTRYMSDAGVGYNNNQNVAQSVRVGITGQLSRIEFWTHRPGNEPGDLKLDFRPLQLSGFPADSDSSSFGQVVIPGDNIAILTGPGLPPDVSPFLLSVDVTSLNLHFNAGDYFAVNFSNTDPSGGTVGTAFGVMGDIATAPGPYAIGQAYLRNSQQNSGQYFLFTDGLANLPGPNWVDLGFRTFVLVPEPSTLFFLAIGAVSLLGRRRR